MPTSPRLRRLMADRKALEQLKADSSLFDFVARGEVPESYTLVFNGRGVWRPDVGAPVLPADRHEVHLRLGAAYPRMMPELTWRSPIFHPNISASGVVCLGGYGTYWVPSLSLDELCTMLWDMIRYANYDPNSPYNRDAAIWAKQQTDFRFPLDPRPIRDLVGKQRNTPKKPSMWSKPAVAPQPVMAPVVAPVAAPPAPRRDEEIVFLESEPIEAEIMEESADESEIVFLE